MQIYTEQERFFFVLTRKRTFLDFIEGNNVVSTRKSIIRNGTLLERWSYVD